jgi:cytochrome c-type biogenesis protein CcmH/NrfG
MDRDRSCPLGEFAPLLANSDITYYSLQVGSTADEISSIPHGAGMKNLTEHLVDFDDTAALLSNLDLIITIDTSVAHLAGALGKSVWVLLAHKPDWRWMLDRKDSPWYPTMRLFRQPRPGDWHSVIIEVVKSLRIQLQQEQASALSEEKRDALFQSALRSLEYSDPGTAIRNLRMLLIQDSDDPAIWFNLGRAYDMSGQLTEAELSFREALEQKPDSAAIWVGLANILMRNDNFAQAEVCLLKAHLYAPESIDVLFALNAVLVAQNKSEETLHNCQKILSLKPGSIEAIYDISYSQLCRGEYLAGFANFEARLLIEKFQIDPRPYVQPRWDGLPLDGKSILVMGEQGMGDVINFSRYLPLVAERGGKIVFEVNPPLINLFTEMTCVTEVLAKSKIPPATDCYVQLMSLPHIFGTTLETIPNTVPYLGADPVKVSL